MIYQSKTDKMELQEKVAIVLSVIKVLSSLETITKYTLTHQLAAPSHQLVKLPKTQILYRLLGMLACGSVLSL